MIAQCLDTAASLTVEVVRVVAAIAAVCVAAGGWLTASLAGTRPAPQKVSIDSEHEDGERRISQVIESFTRKTSQMYFDLLEARLAQEQAQKKMEELVSANARRVAAFEQRIDDLERQLTLQYAKSVQRESEVARLVELSRKRDRESVIRSLRRQMG